MSATVRQLIDARRQALLDELDLPPMSLRVLHMLELEYRANGGWPVGVQALCYRTGLSSKASVHAHLVALVDAGVAERGPGRFDGWRPRGR